VTSEASVMRRKTALGTAIIS